MSGGVFYSEPPCSICQFLRICSLLHNVNTVAMWTHYNALCYKLMSFRQKTANLKKMVEISKKHCNVDVLIEAGPRIKKGRASNRRRGMAVQLVCTDRRWGLQYEDLRSIQKQTNDESEQFSN